MLLLLISEHSLADEWVHFEGQTLRFRDPANKERRFVPVRLNEAPLPDTFRAVESVEWRSDQSEQTLARLVAVCTPPTPKPSARGLTVSRSVSRKRIKLDQPSRITAIAFDLDRLTMAYGTRDGGISLSKIDNPSSPVLKLLGHRGPIASLDFHKTQTHLLSVGLDRSMRLWDTQSGACLWSFTEDREGVNASIFAGNGFASCGKSSVIHVWEGASDSHPRSFRGHTGEVFSIAGFANRLMSASADRTIRVWDLRAGQCLRVLEGHTGDVRTLALNSKGTLLLSGSADRTVRLWDLGSGMCLHIFDAHTAAVETLSWHPHGHVFVSGGSDRSLRLWSSETGKLLRIMDGNEQDAIGTAFYEKTVLALAANTLYEWTLDQSLVSQAAEVALANSLTSAKQIQYTNAKVLLVGDSGAGKTGLSKRLAHEEWEPSAASTVGAWATQWSIPASTDEAGEREIWLWDFGGQADQRLIHQLYMDETALAVLVFDAQKADVFETITQWTRDLTRSSDEPLAKLLVAGRIDASPVRVSRQDIDEYVSEHRFIKYMETSALTGHGCSELRDAIVDGIDWTQIPWRSSPILFKKLKEQIVKLKDDGRVLMRFNELRDALRLRLPENEINFSDAELRAVLSLLAGPGVILELEFGAWVLFQPELINAYSQAVIATMRADPSELGCVSEQKVLAGDLIYGGFERIAPEDERIVLLEMHRKLLQRGLCAKEFTDKDALLVFPSYYKRNRPELVGHPAVLVSYLFDGVVDELYSTLVVRLDHTHEFKRTKLWKDAAEFSTRSQSKIGVKLSRHGGGAAAKIEIYCEPDAFLAEKIIFLKYIHDHLRLRGTNVIRRRHYVCPSCLHSLADLDAVEKRRQYGKADIGCPLCDERVRLQDELEDMYCSPAYQSKVRRLEGIANEELDNESKERLLVGEVISKVALANQLSREKLVSDHGIDMEIEFRQDDGTASGQLLFLQLKSGDSYTRTRADGKEVFTIKNERHADYWANQIAPVMLVLMNSNGDIRWMEIRKYLRDKRKGGKAVKQIEFIGERMDTQSIMKWRDTLLRR